MQILGHGISNHYQLCCQSFCCHITKIPFLPVPVIITLCCFNPHCYLSEALRFTLTVYTMPFQHPLTISHLGKETLSVTYCFVTNHPKLNKWPSSFMLAFTFFRSAHLSWAPLGSSASGYWSAQVWLLITDWGQVWFWVPVGVAVMRKVLSHGNDKRAKGHAQLYNHISS